MNTTEFKKLGAATEDVFAALYLIDVDQLTAVQRRQHQEALAAAYLAMVEAENAEFELLGEQAKQELAELLNRVLAMQEGVTGLKTPPEKLAAVAGGLDFFARLAKTLQI